MADCFSNIVGLSDRDCDCFSTGRPDAPVSSTVNRQSWQYQKFTAPDAPPDPYTLTTTYDLPEDEEAHVQLFAGGALQAAGVDFTVTGARQITITTPIPGQVYQIYYLATAAVETDTPAYSESASGLFITDLLPEEEVAALAGCDKTLWDMMTKARSIAVKEFQAAMNTTLARRYKPKFPTFSGNIGESKGTDYLGAGSTYAGLRIRTNGMRSGYLKIKRILSLFEATGSVNVTLYNVHGTVVVPSFSITTAAGGRVANSVSIDLPLLGDFEAEQDYFLVFEYDAANRPKLNKINCGCSRAFSPTLSVSTYTPQGHDPYQVSGKYRYTGANAWHNFLMIGGWQGDSVANFYDAPDTVTQYMNGLCLEVEIGCDIVEGLCAMVSTFGANEYAMSVATAIQRKAAAWLLDRRLSSSLPNRASAVNRDQLTANVRKWEGEFAEIVAYLSANIPATGHDCFECIPRVRTGQILS